MNWWYRFNDRIGRYTTIPAKYVKPLLTLTWGCGTHAVPDFRNVRVTFGADPRTAGSLYYNGLVFIRVMLPFYIGIMVRWSGSPRTKYQFLQTHVGFRINGAFAITCRIQSDESGVISNTGDATRNNLGQAVGWACGTK